MLVVGIASIEVVYPFVRGGQDLLGVAGAQLDASAIADTVLRLLQEIEELLDRFPGNPGWLRQRSVLTGDAVDAAVLAVPAWIAQVVLHVADDRVVPVEEVDR